MEEKTITLRDHASGKLSDLMDDEGLHCQPTQRLLLYLVGVLVNYREEGVELFPTIVVCEDVGELIKSIPGAVCYQIGTSDSVAEVGKRVLKECGPLASDGWFVYVERVSPNIVKFGVASYPRMPMSLSVEDIIQIFSSKFAVVVRKVSHSTVELIGSKKNKLSMIFSTTRESSSSTGREEVALFAKKCVARMDESEEKSNFINYYSSLLETVLNASHGSILICTIDELNGDFSSLSDIVKLDPYLDFYRSYSYYSKINSVESYVRLKLNEELLSGLMNSDGIVVFNSSGSVIAYRAFYKQSDTGAAQQAVVGGARRRAFQGVVSLLDKVLSATLFRSQDGLTIFQGGRNE